MWGREVPGPRDYLVQGTGWLGLAKDCVPPAVGAAKACSLVGGKKLAGDDLRLGHSSHPGDASYSQHTGEGGLQASAGHGSFPEAMD